MNFVNRLNQKSAPLRTAVDSGHSPYERGPVSGPTDPRWQLPVCPATGPEVDMMILQANLQRARLALEAAETAALSGIELDPAILKPRKKKPIGKPGCPEAAA